MPLPPLPGHAVPSLDDWARAEPSEARARATALLVWELATAARPTAAGPPPPAGPPPRAGDDAPGTSDEDPADADADPDAARRRDGLEVPALIVGTDLPTEPGTPLPWATDERQVEVATRLLHGHPGDALEGFRAPSHWTTFGLSSAGSARRYDQRRDDPDDPVRRIRFAYALDRDGRAAALIGDEDEASPVPCPTDELSGRLVDVCHCVLGVPTAPPAGGTEELFAAIWLDAVLADLARGIIHFPGWTELAHRHPLFLPILRLGDAELERFAAQDLDAAGRICAGQWSWERIREAVTDGTWRRPDIGPALAAWFDAGSFSRELLARYRRVDDMAAEVALQVNPGVARRLWLTLEAWDLDVTRAQQRVAAARAPHRRTRTRRPA